MRFHAQDEPGEVLAVELDGFDTDASDVDFARPRRRGDRPRARRRRVVLAAVAVVGVGAGAFLLGRSPAVDPAAVDPGRTSGSTVPATLAPASSATAGTDAPAAGPSPDDPAEYVPLPAFATDPGFGVFLANATWGGYAYRLDLPSGAVTRLDGVPQREVFGVIASPNGPAALRWEAGGFIAPLADGTAWRFDGDDLVRYSLFDAELELERLPFEPAGDVGFGGLNGVTADGRPTVQRADGRTYVVAPDGTLRRLADGAVEVVDRGRFAEQRCDEAGACTTLLHTAAGEVLDLGLVEDLTSVSFSPDDTYAAVLSTRTGGWRLGVLDGNGRVLDLAVEGAAPPPVTFGPTSASLGWSPDGRYFFFTADRMYVLDAGAGRVTALEGAPTDDYAIIGVA